MSIVSCDNETVNELYIRCFSSQKPENSKIIVALSVPILLTKEKYSDPAIIMKDINQGVV